MTKRPTKTPFSESVGKTLARQRVARELSLAECAELLGVTAVTLAVLESDQYDQLPHDVYSLGLLRRYSRLLGLDEEVAAQKYLLNRGDIPKQSTSLKRFKTKRAVVTSQLLRWLVLGIVVAAVAGYLVWQLLILTTPPKLVLTSPAEDTVVYTQQLEVRGQTLPSVTVYVNGVEVIIDDEGNFSSLVTLNEGLNTLQVQAVNRRGKETKRVRNIVYQP